MSIRKTEDWYPWPSRLYSVPAMLEVSDEWIESAFGQPLMEGLMSAGGAFVSVIGVLPSGEFVAAYKSTEDGADVRFELQIDSNAVPDSVIEEFIRVTKILEEKIVRLRPK